MLLHIDYWLHTEDGLCKEGAIPLQMNLNGAHMFRLLIPTPQTSWRMLVDSVQKLFPCRDADFPLSFKQLLG
jgi:hypothetical protein